MCAVFRNKNESQRRKTHYCSFSLTKLASNIWEVVLTGVGDRDSGMTRRRSVDSGRWWAATGLGRPVPLWDDPGTEAGPTRSGPPDVRAQRTIKHGVVVGDRAMTMTDAHNELSCKLAELR